MGQKTNVFPQKTILKRVLEVLDSDNRVRAYFIGGSFASEKADKYSDLDLYILVDDKQYKSFIKDRLEIAQQVAPVLFYGDVVRDFHLFIVIFENMVKADLGIAPASKFVHIHTGPFKVLLDRDKLLSGINFKKKVPTQYLTKELEEIIQWFWYDIFVITSELCKDDLWTSHLVIERARTKLANLIRIKYAPQNEPMGYNKLGRHIAPRELAPLMKTFYTFKKKKMINAVNTMVTIFEKEAQFLCRKYMIPYPQHLQTKVKTYFQTELQSSISS